MLDTLVVVEYLICSLVQGSWLGPTCFECDNDRSKIDDRSLNSPINRFRFGSRFSALSNTIDWRILLCIWPGL